MTAVTFMRHDVVEFVRLKKVHLIRRDSDRTLCGYHVSPRRPREEHVPTHDIGYGDHGWNSDVCVTCAGILAVA